MVALLKGVKRLVLLDEAFITNTREDAREMLAIIENNKNIPERVKDIAQGIYRDAMKRSPHTP